MNGGHELRKSRLDGVHDDESNLKWEDYASPCCSATPMTAGTKKDLIVTGDLLFVLPHRRFRHVVSSQQLHAKYFTSWLWSFEDGSLLY
jgi:hypothetical protein